MSTPCHFLKLSTFKLRNIRHWVEPDKVGIPCVLRSSSHHGSRFAGTAASSPSSEVACQVSTRDVLLPVHLAALLMWLGRCTLPFDTAVHAHEREQNKEAKQATRPLFRALMVTIAQPTLHDKTTLDVCVCGDTAAALSVSELRRDDT